MSTTNEKIRVELRGRKRIHHTPDDLKAARNLALLTYRNKHRERIRERAKLFMRSKRKAMKQVE